MKVIIEAFYKCISEIAKPFTAYYPHQEIEPNVDEGVVTFAVKNMKNVTLKGEEWDDDNNVRVSAVTEVVLEVDVYRTIDWTRDSESALDIAERLQMYLKSFNATLSFCPNGLALMPIWSDINVFADFDRYKKWVQVAQFEVKFSKMSEIVLESELLKNLVINVEEVSTLKPKEI